MIVRERYWSNGVEYVKTYSDANKYIRKVGTDEIYREAIDIVEYEYEETNKEIDDEPLPLPI